jgi:hypothetical protein
VLCDDPDGCVRFQDQSFGVGDRLTAPAEGYGYIRQTPELRRFIGLAQAAVDPADPITFAPYHALRGAPDPWGGVAPATGALVLHTAGDMHVPISTGIAYGRAAGAVPFLAPDAADKYPALADYVTPPALYDALGQKTPNRVLIDNHVVEGVARLARHPAGSRCSANERPDPVCHPSCPPVDPEGECLPDQSCSDEGVCRTVLEPSACTHALFDAEYLDEGTIGYDQQHASTPLRLARLSAPATPQTLDEIWAPRLQGVPLRPSNQNAWVPRRRVTAFLNAYVVPEGQHCFEAPNPCHQWDYAQYLVNLTTRFFATEGRDLYYLSNPASHHCLTRSSCIFFSPAP